MMISFAREICGGLASLRVSICDVKGIVANDAMDSSKAIATIILMLLLLTMLVLKKFPCGCDLLRAMYCLVLAKIAPNYTATHGDKALPLKLSLTDTPVQPV